MAYKATLILPAELHEQIKLFEESEPEGNRPMHSLILMKCPTENHYIGHLQTYDSRAVKQSTCRFPVEIRSE